MFVQFLNSTLSAASTEQFAPPFAAGNVISNFRTREALLPHVAEQFDHGVHVPTQSTTHAAAQSAEHSLLAILLAAPHTISLSQRLYVELATSIQEHEASHHRQFPVAAVQLAQSVISEHSRSFVGQCEFGVS